MVHILRYSPIYDVTYYQVPFQWTSTWKMVTCPFNFLKLAENGTFAETIWIKFLYFLVCYTQDYIKFEIFCLWEGLFILNWMTLVYCVYSVHLVYCMYSSSINYCCTVCTPCVLYVLQQYKYCCTVCTPCVLYVLQQYKGLLYSVYTVCTVCTPAV